MLNGCNIRVKHRCKKLDNIMLGPLKVLSIASNLRYCNLMLPESWKIHPVCNLDLLERYKGTGPKSQVITNEAFSEDWVVDLISASGPSDDNPKQHMSLVKWKDCSHEENTWETNENVAEHDLGLLKDYYDKNPIQEKDGRFAAVKERRKIRRKKNGLTNG